MAGVVEGTAGAHQAMRSPINWALLGLVLQRPSYGYELVQRFERVHGEAIELSSPSQIYTALDALVDRDMVELVPAEEPVRRTPKGPSGRQPKPNYRATGAGVRAYEQWLVCQAQQERRRSRMFAQQLAALAPAAALRVLDRCERALLDRARAPACAHQGAPRVGDELDAPAGAAGLSARLLAEEDRLGIGARLEWIAYARRELKAAPTAGARQTARRSGS